MIIIVLMMMLTDMGNPSFLGHILSPSSFFLVVFWFRSLWIIWMVAGAGWITEILLYDDSHYCIEAVVKRLIMLVRLVWDTLQD